MTIAACGALRTAVPAALAAAAIGPSPAASLPIDVQPGPPPA